MRRRIIAAAVACDYVALAVLARENGSRFHYSKWMTYSDDVADAWRTSEEAGTPLLARLVKVLQLPYAQEEDRYLWPALALHSAVTPEDLKLISQLFPVDVIANTMRSEQVKYDGVRVVILASGDWLEGVPGRWSEYPWAKRKVQ
jgi:hypothetical protein